MPIVLSDYDKLVECKGNKHNKIFIVQHRETQEKYILKIIDLHEKESQLREIEVHKHLDHKYVIRLIDYEVREGKLLMLIELAKYGDLYGLLARIDELGRPKILKLFHRILKAIDYLHINGIVHRDIKPENILLTAKFKPKLADFGTSVDRSAIANTFCGTYEYMAPEVYLRCKQTDKIDVWAAGILLYELFNKKTPFKNDTLKTIKDKLENKKIEFKSNADSKLIDFVYYALQFDPKIRPSIKELLKHDIFDEIRPRVSRTSTTKIMHRPALISMREFEQMRTISRPKREPTSPEPDIKTSFNPENFSTENLTKNFENSVRKLKICEYLSNLRTNKETKGVKRPVPSLSNRVNKHNNNKSSLFNDKPSKVVYEPTTKPDVYDFFSLKKKSTIVKSSNNVNKSQLSTTLGSNRLVKAPSMDKARSNHKKTASTQTLLRNNFSGVLHNLYEKKNADGVRVKSAVLK